MKFWLSFCFLSTRAKIGSTQNSWRSSIWHTPMVHLYKSRIKVGSAEYSVKVSDIRDHWPRFASRVCSIFSHRRMNWFHPLAKYRVLLPWTCAWLVEIEATSHPRLSFSVPDFTIDFRPLLTQHIHCSLVCWIILHFETAVIWLTATEHRMARFLLESRSFTE